MGLRPHFRRVARLYDAVVMHARLWPKAHRFTHTAFACAVEPVEFKELGRGRWLLGRRWSPYAFRDQDFLPAAPLFQPEGTPQAFGASPADLEARVRAFCAAQGEPLPPEARVTLVAMPRAFGKSYNPASFLLVTVGGELRCGIAEVHNTFGERKAWFLGAACRQVDDAGRPCLRLRTPKRFYVSPFSGLDTEFEFTLRLPDAQLAVGVDHYEGGRLTLVSAWTGREIPCTDGRLLWLTAKTPFLILKVVALIHLHAAWLWLVKKLPFRRKGDDIPLQRNLRHPTPELTPPFMSQPSLARRLVLNELAKLRQGRLRLRLPEGAELVFGDPAATGGARLEIGDENAFRRIMLAADIGLTEGYMEGEWHSPDLNALIGFFIENIDQTPGMSGSARKALGVGLFRIADRLGHLLRPNDKKTVRRNISEHYDVSNDFFRLWLDPSMMYSSARWEGAATLEQAQANKNESLCRFLQLKPTDHVIEIGTGWGGWALHAVKHHGCRVTSLTISQAQHDLAVERIKAAGLSDRITVKLEDFRDHQGTYDKCVSIEMMEALGDKYLPAFCASIGRLLKPDGIAAFQYITCPDSRYAQFRDGVDFIQKHIFPGSLLLSINRVGALMTAESGFQLERLEEFGLDYARTLDAWCQTFETKLDAIRAMGFDDRFIRKWRLYFRYCQAAFEHRNIGVVQAVYVRPNRKD